MRSCQRASSPCSPHHTTTERPPLQPSAMVITFCVMMATVSRSRTTVTERLTALMEAMKMAVVSVLLLKDVVSYFYHLCGQSTKEIDTVEPL